MDRSTSVHALGAFQGAGLKGIAHYLFHLSTTSVKPSCYLQDLFTSVDARGMGLARSFIEGVYEVARNAGAARVYWQTHESNATAMALYNRIAEKSGFLVYRKLLD